MTSKIALAERLHGHVEDVLDRVHFSVVHEQPVRTVLDAIASEADLDLTHSWSRSWTCAAPCARLSVRRHVSSCASAAPLTLSGASPTSPALTSWRSTTFVLCRLQALARPHLMRSQACLRLKLYSLIDSPPDHLSNRHDVHGTAQLSLSIVVPMLQISRSAIEHSNQGIAGGNLIDTSLTYS